MLVIRSFNVFLNSEAPLNKSGSEMLLTFSLQPIYIQIDDLNIYFFKNTIEMSGWNERIY